MSTVNPISLTNNVPQKPIKNNSTKARFKSAENVYPVTFMDENGGLITVKTSKEKLDNCRKAEKNFVRAFNCVMWGIVASTCLAVTGLENAKDSSFKNFFKKMNWAKCGALGSAAFSLAMLPKCISAKKSYEKVEKAIIADHKIN